jgi:O-antigen/teichoic acid export membrane protein
VTAEPGLRSLVLRGIGWKAVSQVAGQLIGIGSTITLVRLLEPREFGLAAMALVFASLAILISDLGLGSALVQRPTLTEEQRSTAFWTNAGLGLVLTIAGVALAHPLAELYETPRAAPLIAALSVTFLLAALGTTQGALLIRDLRFRSLELRTLVAATSGAVVAIVGAAVGWGAWALIAQALVSTGVSTALLWVSSDWRPRFVFSGRSLRELAGFGGNVFGANLLFYVNRNADNVLIGRFAGASALGVYSVAYNAMLIPLLRLAAPVQQVFFPAFSRIEDPRRVGELWIRVSRLIGALTVPAFAGLAVVAPDFVPIVLGDDWERAVRVLQILAWVGIVQSVSWQTRSVLTALDRTASLFRYAAVSSACTVAAFAVGVHWGIVGVATAYAIVTTLLAPYYLSLACRATGATLAGFVQALAGVVAAATGMAIGLLALRHAVLGNLSAAPRLALLVVVGAAVYAALAWWLAPEVRAELRSLRGRRGADGAQPGAATI